MHRVCSGKRGCYDDLKERIFGLSKLNPDLLLKSAMPLFNSYAIIIVSVIRRYREDIDL